jgi:hypothetical protein
MTDDSRRERPRCPAKLRLASGVIIGLCDLLSGHPGDHGNRTGSWSDGADPFRGAREREAHFPASR